MEICSLFFLLLIFLSIERFAQEADGAREGLQLAAVAAPRRLIPVSPDAEGDGKAPPKNPPPHRGEKATMATFGKLTDYFNRRKSREELRVGRSSRRSGSYCCTVAEAR